MAKKTKLRQEFERLLGKEVCDRTWQRMRREYLGIDNEYDPAWLPVVQGAALLRRINPTGVINAERAAQFGRVVAHFDQFREFENGNQFRMTLLKCFKNVPSRTWLRERGVFLLRPVSVDKAFEILGLMLTKRQFRELKPQIPAVRTVADDVLRNFVA